MASDFVEGRSTAKQLLANSLITVGAAHTVTLVYDPRGGEVISES